MPSVHRNTEPVSFSSVTWPCQRRFRSPCHRRYWSPYTRGCLVFCGASQMLICLLMLHFAKQYQYQLYYGKESNVVEDTTMPNIRYFFTNNDTFTLRDVPNMYFVDVTVDLICYKEGTDMSATVYHLTKEDTSNNSTSNRSCTCLPGYYGQDCGIPDAVWHSRYHKPVYLSQLKRRSVPRRVINGFPLLKEETLLEARLHDLGDAVDLYMFAESNFSAHGDRKELYILDRLHQGFLSEFHNKILHVYIDFFPEEGKTDSWVADQYLRVYMGKMGIPRILGIRDDDLYIVNDADEVPSRPLIMFLKLYDGFTEPVGLTFRWSVYGFFWKNVAESNALTQLLKWKKEATTMVFAVGTMGLLTQVLDNDPFLIRMENKHAGLSALKPYMERHPGLYDPWVAGSVRHYAGWHCSWCYDVAGIVLKLDSAQAGDKPRWGDYPEKHEPSYLESLVRDGRWFDGSSNMMLADPNEKDYAPPYLLAHSDRFYSVLYHPKQNVMKDNTQTSIGTGFNYTIRRWATGPSRPRGSRRSPGSTGLLAKHNTGLMANHTTVSIAEHTTQAMGKHTTGPMANHTSRSMTKNNTLLMAKPTTGNGQTTNGDDGQTTNGDDGQK